MAPGAFDGGHCPPYNTPVEDRGDNSWPPVRAGGDGAGARRLTYSTQPDPDESARLRDARHMAMMTGLIFASAVVFPALYLLNRRLLPAGWTLRGLLDGTLLILAGLSGLLAVVYSFYSVLFIPLYWRYIRRLPWPWGVLALCGPLGLVVYLLAVLAVQAMLKP